MPAYFDDYFKALQSKSLEEITEHSHRTPLENLLNAIAQHHSHKLQILHEPKRTQGFGAPDFKISSAGSIIGYVENKKLDEVLSKLLTSNQIKKYKALNDNILLTNYKEFVWLKGEEKISKTLFTDWDLLNRNTKLDEKNVKEVEELILKFYSQPPLKIATSKKLAEALAVRAKYLKDFLNEELDRQHQEGKADKLVGLYETFREFIFHELTSSEFADAFAQNLAYGLFLAKLNANAKQVTLLNAKEFIPHSFELIKELVDFLDELKNTQYAPTRWIVEEVLTIMNNLNLQEIQRSLFYRTSKRINLFNETDYGFKDPFIYFYEDFLAAYDKALRKAKGVYYTPPPIVNFIVRAINDILKTTFNIKDGLADMNKVTVLDFATGTGTFLVDIIQHIIESAPANTAKRRQLVKEHILKNLYGFEYLIAPYTIAHLKLSQYLKDAGYPLEENERLQVYLTNTLEPANKQTRIPLLPALSEETRKAQEVKDKKILVITGNPPYAGHSKNPGEHKVFLKKGDEYTSGYRWNTTTNKTERKTSKAGKDGEYKVRTWIGEKLMDYFFVDGKPLGERNPKWLQDDYVKFIRFAQDKIDNAGEGVVGIITNHSFLDNPTFRGMRQSLMNSFDHMYFIDLHGNSEKKEKTPEGKKDENVFDIKQGVAISIMIKKKGLEKKIFHTDWWGTREVKYKNGWEEISKNIHWLNLDVRKPYFLFNAISNKIKNDTYEWSINEIFKESNVGIVTSDDKTFVAYSDSDLIKNLRQKNYKADLSIIKEILFKPFDKRKIYYDVNLIERARLDIMSNMQQGNIALIGMRQYAYSVPEYCYALVSSSLIDNRTFVSNKGIPYLLPLYIYQDSKSTFFLSQPIDLNDKNENFLLEFRNYIDNLYNYHFTPEQILGYIYAILHSPTYRTKYAEFLKIDFPRIPFTEDKELFQQLSDLGWQLIQAHLMNEDVLTNIQGEIHFTDNGSYEVEKPVFNNDKLFINKQQYFYPVTKQVYEFYIGGYQVLDKYLKDRKGRKLELTEITHIGNIVKVVGFTIQQMQNIDALTKNWI